MEGRREGEEGGGMGGEGVGVGGEDGWGGDGGGWSFLCVIRHVDAAVARRPQRSAQNSTFSRVR